MERPKTRALAEHVANSRFADLPASVVAYVKLLVLDGKSHVDGNPVEIELTDGTVLSACGKARGDAENPVHMSDVVEKFTKITQGLLAPAKQKEIAALCERLVTVDDVSVLVDQLQG